MDSRIEQLNKIAPRPIRVQAALWVTDLHGPNRDAKLEARVKRWIAEDPRHAAAFELATEAWQRSGNLPFHIPKTSLGSIQSRSRLRPSRQAVAGMTLLCLALIGAIYFLRDNVLATGPGEQKTVELTDGTQVSLNANSRVIIQFDARVRRVALASGEVLFDVAKHQSRPFIVVIGDRKVIAVGTSFMVRREQPTGSYAVTLVEGRVAVEPISWPDRMPGSPATGLKLLNPGQRLRFARGAVETLDAPSIEKVTAWQRGQLIFDDTSLSEAAAEFNRYGAHKITVEGTAVGKLRVGGVFRIGDAASFAQAMAEAHHLRIVERGNSITLADETVDSQ